MGRYLGHGRPTYVGGKNLHDGVEEIATRLILPGTSERITFIGCRLGIGTGFYGAIPEYIAPLGRDLVTGCRDDGIALDEQIGVIEIVITSAADKIYGPVYGTLFVTSPGTGHIGILSAYLFDVFQYGLVTSAVSDIHAAEIAFTERFGIFYREILHIELLTLIVDGR